MVMKADGTTVLALNSLPNPHRVWHWQQGSIDNPQLAPTSPNDYLTGFLGALGTLVALLRRSEEGGSYHVRVALARSAIWLQSYGKVDTNLRRPKPVPQEYIA